MQRVEQRLVDKGKGDCMTAVLASLLDIPYEAVPNFNFLPEWIWHNVYIMYLWSLGWEYDGNGHHDSWDVANGEGSFNGFYEVSIPSRTYDPEEGITHAVVMDTDFICVHDPHPNKKWQGENIKDDYLYFYGVKRRTDDAWVTIESNKPVS